MERGTDTGPGPWNGSRKVHLIFDHDVRPGPCSESECSEDGTVVHLDPICADLDISNLHYSIRPGNQTIPGNTTVLDW